MTLQNIGLTFSIIGEIILAYMVLSVHQHIRKEKKIDMGLLVFMSKERRVGLVGVGFLVAGYLLQLFF